MRVLHVISRMNVGGTATYLFNLLQGLKDSGVNNILVFGDVPWNEQEDPKVEFLVARRAPSLSRSFSPVKDFLAYREIKSTIEEFQPDIVHSHTFKAGLLVRLIPCKLPLVHTFHGHHLYDPEYRGIKGILLKFIERVLAKRNKAIISIGERVRMDLLDSGIGKTERMVSIPPGIQMPEVLRRGELLSKFNLSKNRLNVVWMGRLTDIKRPDRVLDIALRIPEVDFLLVGDGELRESLVARRSDNVKFLGIQKSEEVWSVADIGLLTSDSEGMPLSLIEAQASGVPCVATNVGSVSEIVIQGKTGFLTKLDIDSICESINELKADAQLRLQMSKDARVRAHSNFSVQRMVDAHKLVYRSVLS